MSSKVNIVEEFRIIGNGTRDETPGCTCVSCHTKEYFIGENPNKDTNVTYRQE